MLPRDKEPERSPDAPAVPDPADVAEAEPKPEARAEVSEVAELKDKYLRLAAEFDNFRKRAVRERAEIWSRAQADLVQRLVDALDDLARFAHVDPAETDAKTIHDGVDMVERKIWKQLEAAGVKRIDQVGVSFDPNVHEAVTTTSAPTPEQDHTVGTVVQAGYQLGGALIRPARVVVQIWQGDTTKPATKGQ